MSNNESRCPYCGGTLKSKPSHNGYKEMKCSHCSYSAIIKSDEDIQQIYELGRFSDAIIGLAHRHRAKKKSDKIREWEEWSQANECVSDDCMIKYGGNLANDPLFAIAHAANLTYGFQTYKSQDKTTIESLYKVASDYLKENPNAKKVKELLYLYDKNLREKEGSRKKLIGIVAACFGVVLVVGAVSVLALHSPVAADNASGIVVNIPAGSISMLEKFSVNVEVEEHSQGSPAYIDAKNALKNQTDKFTLFDISLKNGKKNVKLDGSVIVEIPIPEGYDTSCLRVYYIESNEKYQELPATVSVAKNTISFETNHFSLYAVAQRNPIVSFDTQGGSEIAIQSVKREGLAQRPSNPQKHGYTFGTWMLNDREWDFSADTVTVDITLVATWIPNQYTVTFDATGGVCETTSLDVTYMSGYGALPNAAKNGYVFAGWYTDAEKGTLVKGDTVVSLAENHTLYARYESKTFSATLNTNGGKPLQAVKYNIQTEGLQLPKAIRAGYEFLGWYSSSDFSGEKIEHINKGTSSDMTLYAKWSAPIKYSITYVVNGGIMPPDNESYTSYTVEDKLKLPTPEYSSNSTYGKYNRFIGWYEDEALTVPFVDDLSENPRNLTLYAKWDALDRIYIKSEDIPSVITDERVLIDFSSYSGILGVAFISKTITVTNAAEVIIVGNSGLSYSGINIVVQNYVSEHSQARLVLDNFKSPQCNITASGNHEALKLILECNGDSSLARLSGFGDVTVTGSGHLKIIANKSNEAIKVEKLAVDGNVILTATGGIGEVGGNGPCAPKDGKDGSDGEAGKIGYSGISAKTVSVINGAAVNATGGKGGNGGSGGCCNPSFTLQGDKEYGGDGGAGGAGGYGIDAVSVTVDKSSSLNITGGVGGNGGAAGGIFENQPNGVNGKGGNGGAGGLAINASCTITGNAILINGTAGEKNNTIDCASH